MLLSLTEGSSAARIKYPHSLFFFFCIKPTIIVFNDDRLGFSLNHKAEISRRDTSVRLG